MNRYSNKLLCFLSGIVFFSYLSIQAKISNKDVLKFVQYQELVKKRQGGTIIIPLVTERDLEYVAQAREIMHVYPNADTKVVVLQLLNPGVREEWLAQCKPAGYSATLIAMVDEAWDPQKVFDTVYGNEVSAVSESNV